MLAFHVFQVPIASSTRPCFDKKSTMSTGSLVLFQNNHIIRCSIAKEEINLAYLLVVNAHTYFLLKKQSLYDYIHVRSVCRIWPIIRISVYAPLSLFSPHSFRRSKVCYRWINSSSRGSHYLENMVEIPKTNIT